MRIPTLTVRRALLLTTLVAIVPALAIIIVSGVERGRVLEQNVRADAQRQVEAIAEIQTQTVARVIRMLETVAALPAFRDGDVVRQKEILAAVLDRNPEYHNMSVTDLDGIVVASPGLEPGTDLSDRVHIRQCISSEAFSAGEFILARDDGNPAFPFAIPIRDAEGTVTGVLATVFSLASYAEFFERLELPRETVLGITDRNGVRIFFRPVKATNPVGVPIRGESWRMISSGDDRGTIVVAGSDEIRRFYAYQRLYLPGTEQPYLYVIVGFPESLAFAAARQVLLRNVLFMAGVVVLASLTARYLGGAVFGRRIEELAVTAKRISTGDLSARTGVVATRSEITQVAAAIDDMAVRLQDRDRERTMEQERIARSLAEKEVLLKEIHHRVKNNMQLILSIIHLQRGTTTDLDEFCTDLETRISAIAGVHEMLYQSTDLSTISMPHFFEGLTGVIASAPFAPRVTIRADGIALPIERAIPISLITSELLVNAVKYGGCSGGGCEVVISLVASDSQLILSVTDHGPGFPADFVLEESEGLGMRLVEALADQLRASVSIVSDVGASVVLTIPR